MICPSPAKWWWPFHKWGETFRLTNTISLRDCKRCGSRKTFRA